jgi:hypothetical protein
MKPHHRKRTAVFSAALALVAAACASGGAGGTGGSPRGTSTKIVQEELTNLNQLSALAAIQRLRPNWLRTRTGAPPQVHVDGNFQMGGVETLRTIPIADIQEIEYLNAADATTRFGTNYVSGAILVKTKR